MIESGSSSDNDVMRSYSRSFFSTRTFLQCWKVKRGCRKLRASFAVWSFMRVSTKRCLETNRMLHIMQCALASFALIFSDFIENYYIYPFSVPTTMPYTKIKTTSKICNDKSGIVVEALSTNKFTSLTWMN